MFFRSIKYLVLAAGLSMTSVTPAFAHLDPLEHGSFAAGFTHPIFGPDHILAMVAVGLWAAILGGRAIWQVPLAFVTVMAAGFTLALSGIGLPLVEPMILASVTVLGLLVCVAWKLPASIAAVVAAFFALFHGYAHGGEMGTAGAFAYGLGFAAMTALLHIVGIGFGCAIGSRQILAARLAGAGTAFAGLWLALAA